MRGVGGRIPSVLIGIGVISALLGCPGVATAANVSPTELVVEGSSSTGSFHPSMAIDGKHDTRWVSGPFAAEQWLQIEFPEAIEFSGLQIEWSSDLARAQAVQVSVSTDGTQWTAAFDSLQETQSVADVLTFDPLHGRYLRLDMTGPARGNLISITEIQIPGVTIQEPFLHHIGLGSGQGEAWLPSPGERLKLDVMIPVYLETFTWSLDRGQEYLVTERLVEYRDMIDQIIGHHMTQDYHLVVVDVPLTRDEITETEANRFWLRPEDVWNNLGKAGIDPGDFDLVWALWSWANVDDARQMYGGAAAIGADNTPFMSFSVSPFDERSSWTTLVLEHEAAHTYEFMFNLSGQAIDTVAPGQGFPHADYVERMLPQIVAEEPGLFAPFMSDDVAVLHGYDGPRPWPSGTMQRAVLAWTHRRQPREWYLQAAERFGELAPPRPDIQIEPLFSSVHVVTDRGSSREVFLPIRVRNRGHHISDVSVTATVGDATVVFDEDSYDRTPEMRMPRQERWSIGWDGNAYYGGYVTVHADADPIELHVTGEDIDERFTIPVTFIQVTEERIDLDESPFISDHTASRLDDGTTLIEDDTSVVYRIPTHDFDDLYLDLTGSGWGEIEVSSTGRVYLSIWSGELADETIRVHVPSNIATAQDDLYIRVQVAPAYERLDEGEAVFQLGGIAAVKRRYDDRP